MSQTLFIMITTSPNITKYQELLNWSKNRFHTIEEAQAYYDALEETLKSSFQFVLSESLGWRRYAITMRNGLSKVSNSGDLITTHELVSLKESIIWELGNAMFKTLEI
jgi:hypothetical protein